MSTSKPTSSRSKVISCAECRRLKLRCDRQFPCHNCTKRGLSALCPEGAHSNTGQEKTDGYHKALCQPVPKTERLNRKNAELQERIRLLEGGLASLQSGISDEPHPLLVKTTLDAADMTAGPSQHQRELDEINDSLGTLTIDSQGRSFFLGQSAGIESLFRNELRQLPKSEKPVSHSPSVLHSLGIFSSLHDSERIVMDVLQGYLPSSRIAWSLAEAYFEYGSWLYNPLPKTLFLEQVYDRVYGKESERGAFTNVCAHDGALLFMVLAMGSFFSSSHSPDVDDAEQYHQLARTALSCDAILVDPTMAAIRTLMLMAFYHLLRDKNGPQHCWAILGLASHMAQNIGLRTYQLYPCIGPYDSFQCQFGVRPDRDSLRWKLDESLVQDRRILFWEIYWFSLNQSLNFGRPPSLLLAFCDCEQPRNMERYENRPGEIKPGFHLRKYQFAFECLSQVIEAILGIKTTPYSTILALDRKIRDSQALKVPPNGACGPADLGASTLALTLQRFMLKAICEMTLMYLHRRYFARAVRDYPEDILGCRYGPSVLATYRSACVYISLMRGLFSLHPKIASRYYIFWNHLLAASIVVGSVATKCPTCVLAPSAISEIDGCFFLFEKAASLGGRLTRPARALTIVSKLRDRAHRLAAALRAGLLPKDPAQQPEDISSEQPDELSILSGRGRLVSAMKQPLPRSSEGSPSGSSPRVYSGTLEPERGVDSSSSAQPSLLENLGIAAQHTEYPSPWDVTMWNSQIPQDEKSMVTSPSTLTFPLIQGVSPASDFNASQATSPTAPMANFPAPTFVATPEESYTPAVQNFSTEQSHHPDPGTIVNWESNWQGFIQQLQLGVHCENDDSV